MARRKTKSNIYRGENRQPFRQNVQIGTVQEEYFQFEESVVVDVIVNDNHPSYAADGTNVGTIVFRLINSQQYLPDESLNEAIPYFSNISEYPLLNEIVYVFRALNRWYYLFKFNISNQVTAQPVFGLNEQLSGVKSDSIDVQQRTNIANGGSEIKTGVTDNTTKLGNTFVDKKGVYRLRQQEGDIVIEGRSGHSIRLGSNSSLNQAPNLLLRVGTDENIEDSRIVPLVDENINSDLSSIWMVANQIIPLTFATVEDKSHFKSMDEPLDKLAGNQIVINSDRISINTKRNELMVSTFLGTHFSTLKNHTVDAAKDYKSSIGRDCSITIDRDYLLSIAGNSQCVVQEAYSLRADKIYLGSLEDDSQPMVLGEQLRKFINELLMIFIQNSAIFTLPTVGMGPLNPTVLAQIQALQIKYGIDMDAQEDPGFLSKNIFVKR